MKMKPTISVVLPTYNRCADLKRCLDSLMRQSYKDFEIIVIDNGSTDGTSDLLKLYPVKVIKDSTKNLFYLSNLGWRNASADIVAYVSDDCEAHPDWLKSIVVAFHHSKNVGAVGGPAIAMRKQEIASMYDVCKNSVILGFLAKIYAVVVMENRFFDIGVLCQSGAYTMGGSMPFSAKLKHSIHVDFLTITNMAVRKSAIQAVSGFDEGFPQHHGDADLSIRMKKSGYKLIFDPKVVVWHHPNPRGPSRSAYYLARDYARFYIKDIHPSKPSGYLRLVLNTLFFNLFWLYKAIHSKSILPLSGISGFVSGVLHHSSYRAT